MLNYRRPSCVFLVLLVSLAIRALMPYGYMPAAPGSGLLLELCPDNYPAGLFAAPGPHEAHRHLHGSGTDEDDATAQPDRCQLGHLLSATAAVDDAAGPLIPPQPVVLPGGITASRCEASAVSCYRSRAPPA